MRFAFLLLVSIPVSISIKCYIGEGAGDNNQGFYLTLPCGDDNAYCYKVRISRIFIFAPLFQTFHHIKALELRFNFSWIFTWRVFTL